MADGTKIQQSMTVNPSDYVGERMVAPRKGVILEVKHPDDLLNRSSMEHKDFRGYLATATVLIVEPYSVIPNVLIPPGDSAHGLDGFEEWYPRGSSKLVTGEELDISLSQIDPYDLDGDWCIIQFINGQIDSPYVARWWPNPRNIYDTLTTGQAYPPQVGSGGTALKQKGRYFRRTNGVEYVVTPVGDIWLSTFRSGSLLNPGGDLDNGRFPRTQKDVGGNIKVQVKPSKAMELSWDEQVDGIGADDVPDESLPQPNPAKPAPLAKQRESTYVRLDKEKFELEVPLTLEVRSQDKITLKSTNTVDIETDVVNLKTSTGVNVGDSSASESMVLGDQLKTWLETHTHPTGTGPSGPPIESPALVNTLSTKHKVDK